MSLFDEITQLVRGRGWNPIVGNIRMKEDQWYNWLRGDVNGFHTFNMKINGVSRQFERQTMNMPKKICEDYHSLIWNDRCQIKFKDKKQEEVVMGVLEDNSFDTEFGTGLEMCFATGMFYMAEYIGEDGKTKIDYITYQNALPLEFDNIKVKALLTISFDKYLGMFITHLTYHSMKKDKFGKMFYNVKHEVFVSKSDKTLGMITKSPQIYEHIFGTASYVEEANFAVEKPFFQVIRPNIKNHFDCNSPYGVSIYATMISYFVIIDTLFDALQSDTNNNKTRIIVDSQMLKVKQVTNDETGDVEYINYFDPNNTELMALPLKSNDRIDQKAIEYFAGEYHHDQLELALNAALRYAGFRAGLGRNYYQFQQNGDNYQNELNVVSSNADTYRNKKKHEIIIGAAIKDLCVSILELEKMSNRYSGDIKREDIEVEFDDSIVIDDEAEEAKYKELVEKGLIPSYMLVAKMLKIDDTKAKEYVLLGQKERQEENERIAAAYKEEEPNVDDEK